MTEQFRSLLSCFATGVTVATTVDGDGKPWGMTASAVASVSLEPPLLLICVDREAKFHAAVDGAAGFALNVLAANQEEVSRTFASRIENPFASADYRIGPDGFPLLAGVVAHIICASWGTFEAGDHTVFFGRVSGGQTFDAMPLIHYRSEYTTTDSTATDGENNSWETSSDR